MTRAEILNCLTDRPCDSCKFHESGRCERWDCVFEEKPDDAEDCEDAISRQAAIDLFTATKLKQFDFILYARAEIKMLPSVTPKQKAGRWIKVDDEEPIAYDCSECGVMVSKPFKYCLNCGAKMEESEDNE